MDQRRIQSTILRHRSLLQDEVIQILRLDARSATALKKIVQSSILKKKLYYLEEQEGSNGGSVPPWQAEGQGDKVTKACLQQAEAHDGAELASVRAPGHEGAAAGGEGRSTLPAVSRTSEEGRSGCLEAGMWSPHGTGTTVLTCVPVQRPYGVRQGNKARLVKTVKIQMLCGRFP